MGQTVRPIITSGTVASGGVLISAVDGTAFIDVATSKTGAADFSTAILAAVANNDVIELTSKTNGRKIYGYAKAAGTGETLGDAANTSNCENLSSAPYDVFTDATPTSFHAEKTSAGTKRASTKDEIVVKIGELWRIDSTLETLSGTKPSFQFRNSPGGTYLGGVVEPAFGEGNNTWYTTTIIDTTGVVEVLSSSTNSFNISNLTAKKVLTPSAAGVTLTNTAGGTTYNFALKDSAFTYNDSAGYDYRILSSTAYGKLIATQSPVSGTLHIATKDGEAMFFHDSIDFSAYAGTDAGSTPYLFVFYDATGKSAQAYAGAVGGGLTTDSNLLTNGDFESGDPPDNWSASGGTASQQADPRTGSAGSYSGQISYTLNAALRQSVSLTAGRLVCLNVWRKIIAGTSMIHYLIPDSEISIYMSPYSSSGTWENVVGYATINTTKTHNLDLYTATSGVTRTARYDDVILSYLTDVPATGLHLMSAKNGTTRNMKSVESGFNPNAITRVNIYRAY